MNKKSLKIAVGQLNPTVGDVRGNADMLLAAVADADADMLVAGELFLSGYPPEDLVMKPAFLNHIRIVAEEIAASTRAHDKALVFGLPFVQENQIYNAVMFAAAGTYEIRTKHHLPNYGVFDEQRLFTAGDMPEPIEWRGLRIGLPICEDIWHSDICLHLKQQGADLLISPNGSPFERGKYTRRLAQAKKRVQETGLPLVYVNQFGGQDELVFDGGSFAIDKTGAVCAAMPLWERGVYITDIFAPAKAEIPALDTAAELYTAAMIGLRDYVEKSGFPSVLLGLSGGIDSALCAAIAVDALGAARVKAIMLPSQYTSQASTDDALACAAALGVGISEVSIEASVAAVAIALPEGMSSITQENIQSRMRGLMLMALSNNSGAMLMTTGNKSEMAVGYATLYGDMNGGYNPIKDIYKTEVFALCKWRNGAVPLGGLGQAAVVIPPAIISKPPSAELRPDQKDEDSLPPYDVLDDILHGLIEEEASLDEIVARGHDKMLVKDIERLLYRAEFKRRQAAPGLKTKPRNFGRDRRYPIVNGFREES
ncbi:MAG: NAD+ synthase [Alphaproteobacteria bacterium]|nr:NAD+ synthase [Alphaproteobacteria bacterium]